MSGTNKKELVFKHLYLVRHFASKYYIADFNINYADLITSGTSGLIEAIDDYNPKLGTKLSSVASPCIKFKILNEMKRTSALDREDVLHVRKYLLDYLDNFRKYNAGDSSSRISEFININENFKNKCKLVYTAYLNELFICFENSIAINRLVDIFNKGLKGLSDMEQKVLYMYYTEEFNYSQIALILEVSEMHIFFIHTLALAKLEEYFLNATQN